MAYSNFKPTVWSKQIQLDLDKFMIFKDICNTNFQGDAGRGKTVKIIGVSKPTVKDYIPGSSIDSAETPTDTSMTLAIDQYKYTNFLVDDVDEAQADVDIMKYLMQGSAQQLAQAADSYIAGLVKEAKSDNVMASTAVSSAKAAKELIDNAFIKLWDAGVKTGKDTFICVSPWFYSLFKNSLVESLTDNREILQKGIFGVYNGCYVKMSNNLYNDGTDDYLAIMTKDAIAFASGIEEVDAYRPHDSFSDAVKVLHTYGAKVVRPEQIVCIKAHKA